jgi:hypothetical protein
MLFRLSIGALLIMLTSVTGCRSTSNDRIPATAVDNPDPIFGGTAKAKNLADGNKEVAGAPTSQTKTRDDRIGPLTVPARQEKSAEPNNVSGASPGTASLTGLVKQPKPEPVKDAQVQPVQNTLPVSNPDVVQNYRQRLIPFGVVGLRTKPLGSGAWEAIAHFPAPDDPNQLRRIETQGVTEADALLAIVEQVEKPK